MNAEQNMDKMTKDIERKHSASKLLLVLYRTTNF